MKTIPLCVSLLLGLSLLAQQKGVSTISPSDDDNRGSTYAVVVGISDYQDEDIPDLRFADKDALAFAGFLQSPAGGELDEDHLKVMINEQATVAQFAMQLDWLWEVAEENDRVIIYFSGHGDVEKKSITQPGYLLCWDAPASVYLAGGAINVRDLNDVVSTLSIQNKAKVVLITDACRAGKLSGSTIGGAQATASNLAKQYANEIKILSCQPDEYSIEGEQWGNGRGAFSYHLIDGLYGMADRNNDLFVNLLEIGRYLEDHVPEEVSPLNQMPMTIGNRSEKLATVFPDYLDLLRKGKEGQMVMFTPTDSRGIEEEILAAADTSIRKKYRLFKKYVKEKTFLSPPDACAETFYAELINEPQLARLHASMTRNYAAALQDEAQQELNLLIKTGVTKDILTGKSIPVLYNDYPAYLERAAQLLGPDHYMYNRLQARKYYFKGKLSTDYIEKRKAYFTALKWQSDMPHVYLELGISYDPHKNTEAIDSTLNYWKKASEIVPSWIAPNICFSIHYLYNDVKKANQYLDRAFEIDSNSIVLHYLLGMYNAQQGLFEKAELKLLKVIEDAGPEIQFPRAHFNLGNIYLQTNRFKKAEKEYKKTLSLDSTYYDCYAALGELYYKTQLLDKAEEMYKYIISKDTSDFHKENAGLIKSNLHRGYSIVHTLKNANFDLWKLYVETGRTAEAQVQLNKIIESLNDDDDNNSLYFSIAEVFYKNREFEKADHFFNKYLRNRKKLNWRAPTGLAWFYLFHGDFEKAKFNSEKVIEKLKTEAPDFFNPYYDLAWIYFSAGKRVDAVSLLDSIIEEQNTKDIQLNGHRIMFKAMLNHNDEAKAHFENFVSAIPDIMDVWDCLELIQNDKFDEANISYHSIMDGTYPWWAKRYLRLSFVRFLIREKKFQQAINIMENCKMDHYTFNYLLLSSDECFAPLKDIDNFKALIKKHFPEKVEN